MSKATKTKTERKLKPTPVPAGEATLADEIREGQKAYLLLQLLDAENQTLAKGPANKFRDSVKKSLDFRKTAFANYRRERLAELNYIKITPKAGTVEYTLLPDGTEFLSACISHLSHLELRIKGKTLNTLVAAAREPSLRSVGTLAPNLAEQQSIDPKMLAEAVLSEFEDLRRESHSDTGMVPIHEIRQRIAKRLGASAAGHGVLDEVILGLWRGKRIGLEGISDLGSATEQELSDSIPDNGNTIFYLEVPRDQPVLA